MCQACPVWHLWCQCCRLPAAAGTQYPESQLPHLHSLLGPIWEGGITGPPEGCYQCCKLMYGGRQGVIHPRGSLGSLRINNAWTGGVGPIRDLRSGGIRRPLMVLIMWGRLPSGMWAAWAGSQDSGHLDPTGGRLGRGWRYKRATSIAQSPVQGVRWG